MVLALAVLEEEHSPVAKNQSKALPCEIQPAKALADQFECQLVPKEGKTKKAVVHTIYTGLQINISATSLLIKLRLNVLDDPGSDCLLNVT